MCHLEKENQNGFETDILSILYIGDIRLNLYIGCPSSSLLAIRIGIAIRGRLR